MKTAHIAMMCGLCVITFVAVTMAASTAYAQTLGEIADGLRRDTDRAVNIVYYMVIGTFIVLILIPPAIALARGHKQLVPILLVSIFFSWTGLIWAGLLFYATFSSVSGPIGRRDIDLLRLEIRKLRQEAENPAQA